MGIFNTIMLAATPLLPQDITPYHYKTIQELSPSCWRIEYSIDLYEINGNYNTPIEFLKIINANKYTAIMYCSGNYSQTQESNNYIELNESKIYTFDASANWWLSLAELQDDATNSYYSIWCDNTIEFSVVVQEQRIDNYNLGYQSGYDVGYSEAVKDSKVGSYNWLISAFDTLKRIFEIELLPNLKLGYLLGIPFVIILVRFVLSWFR